MAVIQWKKTYNVEIGEPGSWDWFAHHILEADKERGIQ